MKLFNLFILPTIMALAPVKSYAANNICPDLFASDVEAIVFNLNESPLTPAEWSQIELLFKGSKFQRQNAGDVADHNLAVTMFVNDYNPEHIPRVLNEDAQKFLEIIMSPKMVEFYKSVLATLGGRERELYVRRVQGNSMTGADYNHIHRDNDYDPDFKLAVLLYLSDPRDYRGGELRVGGHFIQSIKPEKYSIVAFRGDAPHEVAEFKSEAGKTRDSIVILIGDHAGPNRRFVNPEGIYD